MMPIAAAADTQHGRRRTEMLPMACAKVTCWRCEYIVSKFCLGSHHLLAKELK